MKLRLSALKRHRPDAYAAALAHGVVSGDVVTIPNERRAEVLGQTESAPSVALPREEWPLWAKGASYFAKVPPDTGVGDTVRRHIGDFTSAAFKAWHQATFGYPCQCEKRQAEWNARFPYAPQPTTPVEPPLNP